MSDVSEVSTLSVSFGQSQRHSREELELELDGVDKQKTDPSQSSTVYLSNWVDCHKCTILPFLE